MSKVLATSRPRTPPRFTTCFTVSTARSMGWLGLHAVALLVLETELGIAQPVDALLAVFVEAGGGHAIGAVDLPRDVLSAGRAHAARQPEERPALAHPHLALGTVGDVGHPVPQRRRGVRREQVGRQLAEVDMTVRRNSLVAHRGLRSRERGDGPRRPGSMNCDFAPTRRGWSRRARSGAWSRDTWPKGTRGLDADLTFSHGTRRVARGPIRRGGASGRWSPSRQRRDRASAWPRMQPGDGRGDDQASENRRNVGGPERACLPPADDPDDRAVRHDRRPG